MATTWQFPQSSTQPNPVVTLDEDGESVFIAPQVFIASSVNQYTVYGTSVNHQVIVAGTVAGGFPMRIGNNESIDSGCVITVEATGQIRAFSSSAAIELLGAGDIINHGLVASPAYYGVFFRVVGATADSTLTNTGTIDAQLWGVYHNSQSASTLITTNSGTIEGDSASYYAATATAAIDKITNTGTMIGDVELGGGDDLYDGHLGIVEGVIVGGAGIDKLYTGAGNNNLLGQDGSDLLIGGVGADTLDGGANVDRASYAFAEKGVVVSLANPAANTGEAAGDVFVSIESLTGTRFNDALTGNSINNAIDASLGNDVVSGGLGNDNLTGGGGQDYFVFNTALNAATNVDTITDFVFTDDTIRLDDAVFIGIGALGTLAPASFKANTTGQADDPSDRIVYDTNDGLLYFDADGNAGGQRVLFAKIGIGLGLTNADFAII